MLSGVSDTPARGWQHRLLFPHQRQLHTLPSATRAAHDALPRLASARQQGLSAASGVSRPAVQEALLGPLQQGCAGARHSPRACLSQPLPKALRMCADKALDSLCRGAGKFACTSFMRTGKYRLLGEQALIKCLAEAEL